MEQEQLTFSIILATLRLTECYPPGGRVHVFLFCVFPPLQLGLFLHPKLDGAGVKQQKEKLGLLATATK